MREQAPVDVEEVREVTPDLVATYQRLVPQLAEHLEPPSVEQLEKVVGSPGTMILVARERQSGEIVGALTLVTYHVPTGPRAWIEDIVVDEEYRGRGIGTQLTNEAVRRVREAGGPSVDLISRSIREGANRLYRRVGFIERDRNLFRFDLE